MPSRRHRPPIPVTLTLPAESPTPAEIDAILMTVDAVVGSAGRTGVVQILGRSHSQKVQQRGWDQLPEYGALGGRTAKEIGTLVDWCIHHDWLRLQYERDIPLLVHSPRGWERTKQLWVQRVIGWLEAWTGQPEQLWAQLEHIHRDIKLMTLEALHLDDRRELAPVLRAWFPYETRAVRTAINQTLTAFGLPALRPPTHSGSHSPSSNHSGG
jgi:hypothetical protein